MEYDTEIRLHPVSGFPGSNKKKPDGNDFHPVFKISQETCYVMLWKLFFVGIFLGSLGVSFGLSGFQLLLDVGSQDFTK